MCYSNCPYEDWEGECRAGNRRGILPDAHCNEDWEETENARICWEQERAEYRWEHKQLMNITEGRI